MRISDWSSDVCSSDLPSLGSPGLLRRRQVRGLSRHRHRHNRATSTRAENRAPCEVRFAHWSVEPPPHGPHDRDDAYRVSRCQTQLRDPDARSRPFQTRSEEHTSELHSLIRISYAVFCLKQTQPTTTSFP